MASVARPIGDLDLHLFGEGTHRRLWELLGPQPLTIDDTGSARSVRFGVWAPEAERVEVIGDWSGWAPEPLARLPGASGIWTGVASAARSRHRYKFLVTGADGRTVMKADPMARQSEAPPSDASVVPMATDHDWGDHEWMQERRSAPAGSSPLRIYEVHLGSWRRGVDTWDDLAQQLGDHVERLGFTHVELMPIAEHPFSGSWGYQVSGYYSPTSRFGDPDGFRRFVDALHQRGLGVIVDWVPAHFPRDEWSLGRFDGTALYEHADPRRGEHPDWGTYVFDYGRNEVRNFLVANALYWMDQFHVDGLRVDAVASMLYLDYSRPDGAWTPNEFGGHEHLEALAFLRETNTVVADEFPDAVMIAEESTTWPGVTAPIADGGLGFTGKWNLGWMHDTLGYLARDPTDRRHHHDELTFPSTYAFDERFVLPLSHDEVVHGKGSLLAKMSGDDWQRFAALRALLAWQWALPGAPLVFMGTELAPWEEWNDGGALPWHLLDHAAHRGVHDLVATLNRVADRWPALWRRDDDPAGFEWLDADDADRSLYAFVRWDLEGAAAVVGIANFAPVARPGCRVGVPWGGAWEILVDTDDAVFWGSSHRGEGRRSVIGTDEGWQSLGSSAVLDLGPMSMVWLGARSPG